MDWENNVPEWKNEGTEPSEDRKTKGFETGYKPPAGIFNWLFSWIFKAVKELQTKFGNHADDKENPHTVTAAQLGLDKVDNTSDSEKSVKYASEAGEGCKVKNALTIRFKGGNTEGTDKWTFDGSTSRSVNITPDKIGAPDTNHTHTLDGIEETDQKKLKIIVNATSTDGIAYTANVEGITELYNGMEITIIPSINNASKNPTLNINGLGAVKIYRPLSFATFVANAPEVNFIRADTPCRLMYHQNYVNGGIWLIAEKQKTSAQDLYGTVPVSSGGTGKVSVTKGSLLVGNGTEDMVEKTPNELLSETNVVSLLNSLIVQLGYETNEITQTCHSSSSAPSGGSYSYSCQISLPTTSSYGAGYDNDTSTVTVKKPSDATFTVNGNIVTVSGKRELANVPVECTISYKRRLKLVT